MNNGLKLLIEEPVYNIDYTIEEKNSKSPSNLFISGPYLMAEQKNKNGRIYSINEMSTEVNRYINEMVNSNRSLGELNHPSSVEINPERACHMITEMKQDGNIFTGKSKVLSTPVGNIVRSLVLDGVKLGISSRALGKLDEQGDHKNVSDFHLICCDIVHDPSAEMAFVDGILESKEWILQCDGSICEMVERKHDELKETCSCLPKHNKEKHILESVLSFIESLKGV